MTHKESYFCEDTMTESNHPTAEDRLLESLETNLALIAEIEALTAELVAARQWAAMWKQAAKNYRANYHDVIAQVTTNCAMAGVRIVWAITHGDSTAATVEELMRHE